MRNIFFVLLIVVTGFVSCSKNNTCSYNDSSVVAPAIEVQALQNYLDTSHQTATANPSGFYYKIVAQGSGASIVNLCSKVTVSYVGKLTNGSIFDQTTEGQPRTFDLGALIIGWQKGIPLLNKGGVIRLFIPPSLGYGQNPTGPIPPNSILVFDITLVDIS